MASPWDNDPEVGATAVAPWDNDPEVDHPSAKATEPGPDLSVDGFPLPAQPPPSLGAHQSIFAPQNRLPSPEFNLDQELEDKARAEREWKRFQDLPPDVQAAEAQRPFVQAAAGKLAGVPLAVGSNMLEPFTQVPGLLGGLAQVGQNIASKQSEEMPFTLGMKRGEEKELPARLGSAAGSAGSMIAGGPIGGAFLAAKDAEMQASRQAFEHAKFDLGYNDQEAKAFADREGAKAAAVTIPQIAAFMGANKLVGAGMNLLPKNAPQLLKEAAGATTGIGGNILGGGVAEGLGQLSRGEQFNPDFLSPENLLTAAAFYGHGRGTQHAPEANRFPLPPEADEALKKVVPAEQPAPAAPTPQETAAPAQPETVPERPETIAAQMDQLVNGQRAAVMIPGFGEVPKRPAGMRLVTTENGSFLFDPAKIDAKTIRELDSQGRQNEILGLGSQTKEAALATGQEPVAVTERQPSGVEVKAAVASPDVAARTAAELEQSKTPGNIIATESPAEVLAKRTAGEQGAPSEGTDVTAPKGTEASRPEGLPPGGREAEGAGARPGDLSDRGLPEGDQRRASRISSRLNDESGHITIPSANEIADFGKRVYQKGMDFARWSAEMVRHLGEQVRVYLTDAWNRIRGQHGEIGAVGDLHGFHVSKALFDRFSDEKIGTGLGRTDRTVGHNVTDSLDAAEHLKENIEDNHPGEPVHLYKTVWHGDTDHIIDYDKPVSEQTPYIKNVLKKFGLNADAVGASKLIMGDWMEKQGNPRRLANALKTAGAEGVEYGSASGGKNQVFYDPSKIEVKRVSTSGRMSGEEGGIFPGKEKLQKTQERQFRAEDIKAVLAGRAAPDIQAPEAKGVFTKVRETIGGGLKDFRDFLNPTGASNEAYESSLVLREATAAGAQRAEQFYRQNKAINEQFDKLTPSQSLQVIDSVERPTAHNEIPGLGPWVKTFRDAFAKRIAEVRALDPEALKTLIENYYPHIWSDPAAALAAEQQGRINAGNLQGSKAFLKRRVIPSVAEGVALGLTPKSWNPGELLQMKMGELDRFIMARKALKVLELRGLVRTEESPGDVPINRQIGGVKGKQFFASPDVARIFNNYLSPGLQSKKGYQALRYAGNLMNQFQLGLSAFHAGFVTIDSLSSKLSHGIYQIGNSAPNLFGQGRIGEGFKKLGEGLSNVAQFPLGPINTLRYLRQGSKVLGEYRTPGYADGDMASVTDALKAGGARFSIDPIYHNEAWKSFMTDVRGGKYGGMMAKVMPAIMEKTMAPLLEYAVPRIKAGIGAEMARDVLSTMKPDATRQDLRREMAKAWDACDDRLGQLVYSNLFWDRTLKDVAMLSTRSVGWNLGTLRALGGGIKDVSDAASAKTTPITRRSSYLMALPISVGLMGAIYQFLKTGQPPQDIKDLFAPRTGKIAQDGAPERVALPSYLKDIFHYGTHPLDTMMNKVHPLASAIDMAARRNADFYGVQIRDTKASPLEQAGQVAKFGAKQFLPFTWTGASRRVMPPGEKVMPAIESFIGIQSAPAEVRRSEAMNKISDYFRDTLGSRPPVPQETYDSKQMSKAIENALRQGWPLEQKQQDFLNALPDKAREKLEKSSSQDPRVLSFQRIPYAIRPSVFDVGTPEEKTLFQPYVYKQEKKSKAAGARR